MMLTLNRKNGDKVPLEVEEFGNFAIHHSIGEGKERFWTLTHIPTLLSVTDNCPTRHDAVAMMEFVNGLDWDWSQGDADYFTRQMRALPARTSLRLRESAASGQVAMVLGSREAMP